MNDDRRRLISNLLWTGGSFAGTFIFRLGTNIILSRMLTPGVFGIMVIVNSIRYGVELLTDVGVEQNIVRHKDGLTPAFLNTAWTIQILRGVLLTAVFLALSVPLAGFYGIDVRVFLLISFAPFLNALHSTAIFALVKGMEVRRRNLFELRADAITAVTTLILAYLTPTVWALIGGALFSVLARSALSYRLPHPAHRPMLNRDYTREILHFGKWIMVSSLVVYAATNLDRIALGKLVPLGVLGVYGIARTIAEIPSTLALRLSNQLVFPALAAARQGQTRLERADIAGARFRFLLLGAVVMATGIAWGDVAMRILFDARYHDAGWMLSLLLIGGTFAVLSILIEALLLGFDRPATISAGNVLRFAILAAGLPLGFITYGLPGAIAATIAAEIARYFIVSLGQRRLGFSFWRQDAAGLLATASLVGVFVLLRHALGLGDPWAAMVLSLPAR